MKYVYYAYDYNSSHLNHFKFPFKIDLSGAKKAFNNTASNAKKTLDKAAKTVSDISKNASSKASKTVKTAANNLDREWKKHKWVDRKRDKNGKWIYDYGFGFPGEGNKKKTKKGTNYGDVTNYDTDLALTIHRNAPHSMFDAASPVWYAKNELHKPSLLSTTINNVMDTIGGNKNVLSMAYDSFMTNKKLANAYARKAAEPVDKKTGFHLKAKGSSKEDDLRDTNPSYGQIDGTGKMNCYACTLAYDLRRRGYDVNAVEDGNGASMGTITSFYKNPKMTYVGRDNTPKLSSNSSYRVTSELKDSLMKEPSGSRGYLCLDWAVGSGHAVAYEREGDKVYIYDAQCGERVDIEKYGDLASSAVCFRTDNLEIDTDEAKKVVY